MTKNSHICAYFLYMTKQIRDLLHFLQEKLQFYGFCRDFRNQKQFCNERTTQKYDNSKYEYRRLCRKWQSGNVKSVQDLKNEWMNKVYTKT